MGGTCTMAQWAARGQPTLASNDKICSLSTYHITRFRDNGLVKRRRKLCLPLAPSCLYTLHFRVMEARVS